MCKQVFHLFPEWSTLGLLLHMYMTQDPKQDLSVLTRQFDEAPASQSYSCSGEDEGRVKRQDCYP